MIMAFYIHPPPPTPPREGGGEFSQRFKFNRTGVSTRFGIDEDRLSGNRISGSCAPQEQLDCESAVIKVVGNERKTYYQDSLEKGLLVMRRTIRPVGGLCDRAVTSAQPTKACQKPAKRKMAEALVYGAQKPRDRLRHRAMAIITLTALIFMGLFLASCAPTTIKRGHHFRPSDLTQIQEGMTKDQVTAILGTPDTTSPVGTGLGYYYISSIEKQMSFMKPDQVDRKVVAVYFNELETVDRIAHYGLRDGKVFDFIERKTGTHARDQGILKSLFRNLGKKQGIF